MTKMTKNRPQNDEKIDPKIQKWRGRCTYHHVGGSGGGEAPPKNPPGTSQNLPGSFPDHSKNLNFFDLDFARPDGEILEITV